MERANPIAQVEIDEASEDVNADRYVVALLSIRHGGPGVSIEGARR